MCHFSLIQQVYTSEHRNYRNEIGDAERQLCIIHVLVAFAVSSFCRKDDKQFRADQTNCVTLHTRTNVENEFGKSYKHETQKTKRLSNEPRSRPSDGDVFKARVSLLAKCLEWERRDGRHRFLSQSYSHSRWCFSYRYGSWACLASETNARRRPRWGWRT